MREEPQDTQSIGIAVTIILAAVIGWLHFSEFPKGTTNQDSTHRDISIDNPDTLIKRYYYP